MLASPHTPKGVVPPMEVDLVVPGHRSSRRLFPALFERARVAVGAFAGRRDVKTMLPALRPDLHIDPTIIDRDEWLAWGEQHLTSIEFDRMKTAIAADRASSRRSFATG